MTGPDHIAEAERLLEAAKEDVRQAEPEARTAYAVAMDRASVAIAAANVHSNLAQAIYLREVGDQLDTFPRIGVPA